MEEWRWRRERGQGQGLGQWKQLRSPEGRLRRVRWGPEATTALPQEELAIVPVFKEKVRPP